MKTALELDREIAESYLGKIVTADFMAIPPRRVKGLVKKVDTDLDARHVMLWVELSNGTRVHVFLTNVVPEVPRATARRRRRL